MHAHQGNIIPYAVHPETHTPRTCAAHRRRSQQSCCGAVYIPLDPSPPSQLAPWEWNGWLEMCKGTGDIEAALSE